MYLQVSSLGPLTLCTEWIVSGVGDRRLVGRGYVARLQGGQRPAHLEVSNVPPSTAEQP
jgi:hypothetical protein